MDDNEIIHAENVSRLPKGTINERWAAMPLPVKLETESIRAGSAGLHKVVVYAIAVFRPANAEAALQANCDVPAFTVKLNACADDTCSGVDVVIDQCTDQYINDIVLIVATHSH